MATLRHARALPLALHGLLILLVLSAAVAALAIGEKFYPPAMVIDALGGTGDKGAQFVVNTLRLPRIAACVVAGASLGMAGYVTQRVLRNPLASPDIIGVTTGASCAAVIYILAGSLGGTAAGFSLSSTGYALGFFATGGALLAGFALLAMAYNKGLSAVRVILLGIGLNAGLGAITSYLLINANLPDVNTALIWLTGSVNSVSWPVIGTSSLLLVAAGTLVMALGRPLRVLELGFDTAAALGLRPHLTMFGLLSLAMVLAAGGTAVAGPVGFVAFVSPHVAARLTRSGANPFSAAATGALIMIVADLVARTVLPVQVPVGIVTSLAGAPLLLFLLLRLRAKA